MNKITKGKKKRTYKANIKLISKDIIQKIAQK